MSVNDMAMQNVHLHHFLKAWDEIALWDIYIATLQVFNRSGIFFATCSNISPQKNTKTVFRRKYAYRPQKIQ
jgi:hypothetical protein